MVYTWYIPGIYRISEYTWYIHVYTDYLPQAARRRASSGFQMSGPSPASIMICLICQWKGYIFDISVILDMCTVTDSDLPLALRPGIR